MRVIARTFLIVSLVSFSACTMFENNPKVAQGAKGGLLGAAAGGAGGALVGSVIANGDVTASAMLGAGLGLPAGVATALIMQKMAEDQELRDNNSMILENKEFLESRQQEIEGMRQEAEAELIDIELDDSRKDYMFTGPTIGGY